MHRIVIANQKGGVGKTTTALSVALSLQRDHGQHVLAVDTDAQFALTRQLGVTPPDTSLVEVLAAGAAPADAIVHVQHAGVDLDLLPGRRDLAEVEAALVSASGREFYLGEALDKLAARYTACVIDTPPTLGQLTVNALATADVVLVPISLQDEGAAQGLVELQARILELGRVRKLAGRPELPEVVCFGNRAPAGKRIAAAAILGALEGLGARVSDVRVPEAAAVHQAAIRRRPLITERPDHRTAAAFRRLACDVTGAGVA